jgi:hypothetical protein
MHIRGRSPALSVAVARRRCGHIKGDDGMRYVRSRLPNPAEG